MKIRHKLNILLLLLVFIGFANNINAESINKERHDFILYPMPLKAPTSLFEDSNNNITTLGKFQGSVTILKFLNSNCRSCVSEISNLIETTTAIKGSNIAIVTVFPSKESMSSIMSFYEEYKVKGLSRFRDMDGLTFNSFGISVVPKSFIINQDGELIAYASKKIDWNKQANINFLRQLMQKTT